MPQKDIQQHPKCRVKGEGICKLCIVRVEDENKFMETGVPRGQFLQHHIE